MWGAGIVEDTPGSFPDALFTATSAACVTGPTAPNVSQLPFSSQTAVLLRVLQSRTIPKPDALIEADDRFRSWASPTRSKA